MEDASLEHCDFELVDPDESDEMINAWFEDRHPDGMTFTVFAQDGTGGLYVIWQRGESLDHAPVVLLGSEGSCVAIAPDAESFLEAIASGWVIDANNGHWFDELEALARRAEAQTWVRQRLGKETR